MPASREAEGQKLVRGGGDAGPRRLSWSAAVELFLDRWMADRPNLRPATLDHYREQLETRLAVFASERGIETVGHFTREHLREFVTWLDEYQTRRGPISQRGKQMALNCAKMLLRWAHQEGLLPNDISRSARGYRLEPLHSPRATRSHDLEALLSAFNTHTAAGIRNTAMVHMMSLCGLRPSEVCDLDAGDLHPREGLVTIRTGTGRGQRARNVELPSVIRDGHVTTQPEVAEALTAWLAVRAQAFPHLEDDDPLFVTLEPGRTTGGSEEYPDGGTRPVGQRMTVEAIRLMLRRAAERAGIDPTQVTPRKLRHYFGLNAAASGVDHIGLMESMGLGSPRMTERYAMAGDETRPPRSARTDVRMGIRLPRQKRSHGRTEVLEEDGISLSEIARRLFRRE